MFYSKTFLAKKSPLGTVWIAAHLQNRLRKSHVVLTDISYTIDQIMLPEAPMALRLSGHLLLGVVRIYSKKVDYLYHDCNEFAAQIRMLFKPITVNLPEDANCASFHAITLPDTFDLDALEVDDNINLSVSDDHLKALEDITLPDQVTVEGDAYISIHLYGLQGSTQSSPQSRRQSVGEVPMEEDVLPPFSAHVSMEINSPYSKQKDANVIVGELTPTNQLESPSPITTTNSFPQVSPDSGFMRDIVSEVLLESGKPGENLFQQENLDDPITRNEILSPISLSLSEEEHLASRPAKLNVVSPDVHETPSLGNFPGKSIPELSIKPSPPVEQKGKKQESKKRKRNRFFDEVLVLTNTDIKNQLEDTSMLVHKRRKAPSSSLNLWKSQCRYQDAEIFEMPLFSGMCGQLIGAYNIRFPVTTADSLHLDPTEVRTTQSCGLQPPMSDLNQDRQNSTGGISDQFPVRQILIDDENCQGMRDIRETSEEFLVRQPQLDGGNNQELEDAAEAISEQSPVEHALFDGTHDKINTFDIASRKERTLQTDTMLTKNSDASNLRSPLRDTSFGDEVSLFGRSVLPASPNDDDLIFLEEDSTPSSSEKTLGCNISGRTRAVALYLKEHSSETQRTTKHAGDLCLNRILEGKTRKQCARMFFDFLFVSVFRNTTNVQLISGCLKDTVLVIMSSCKIVLSHVMILKSYDVIDVQQPEPYDDITFSVNPTSPKLQL